MDLIVSVPEFTNLLQIEVLLSELKFEYHGLATPQ